MILRQNSELRPHRIWNWTIPAWYVTREDGSRFHTCPNAGICAQYCYARNGTYLFRNVLAAHTANLNRVLNDQQQFKADMIAELSAKKFRPTYKRRIIPHLPPFIKFEPWVNWWIEAGGAAVRIHDSGDFFADWYMTLWIDIASEIDDVLFYAYTKEVSMTRRLQETFPPNFRLLFSAGGLEDHLINPDTDRHADVFPTEAELNQAGYMSQGANDLLAILLPTTRIGIPANNIRHFNKRLAGRRFSEAVPEARRMRLS